MKALDILQQSYGYDYPLFTDQELDKAIIELEKLQQRIKELETPKTCDGCRWDGTRSNALVRYCDELLTFVPKEFYCARYEPEPST